MAVIASEHAAERRVYRPAIWKTLAGWGSNYFVLRLLRAALTIFFVMTLTFFLVRLMPGSPIDAYISEQMTLYGYSYEEAKSQALALFAVDVDKPMLVQYFDYLGNLAQGDLGMSLATPGTPVGDVIQARLPWTLFAVGTALLLAFILGVTLGMLMAYRRGTWIDSGLSAFSSASHSIPNYLVALLVIVFLGIRFEVIPFANMRGSLSSGQPVEFSFAFIKDALYHASLPIAIYLLTQLGGWMLLMKSSTISALEEDFVTAARARGISELRIAILYVGRNAILPLFTQFAVAIGFVVGGSLLVEEIFQYEGIGSELFGAIQARDYTMLQGIFLMITIAVVLANLAADLLYSRLDPRIRSSAGGS
ncbi:MAG: ABC transporter permease [Chloroflexota bacterium]|nr:ABC transporter permease [Chloroflexota bacterium]